MHGSLGSGFQTFNNYDLFLFEAVKNTGSLKFEAEVTIQQLICILEMGFYTCKDRYDL